MKIAVCDDDEICRKNIANLLKMYTKHTSHRDIVFSIYSHADDLLEAAGKTGGFDIYILDILMPDTDGVELGVTLRENGYDGKIIYFTASEDFVFDSFKAQPFNYILKPVESEQLFTVLDNAITAIGYKKEKSIIVKTAEGTVRLPLDSIMYAELLNRTVVYHLANGKTPESVTIRTSFREETKELIKDEHFVMCGASIIVNLLHITTSKTNELLFRDGSSIQLSRKLLAELRAKWMEYWMNEQQDSMS